MKQKYRITKNKIELIRYIESFKFTPLSVLNLLCIENGNYTSREAVSRVLKQCLEDNLIGSYLYGNNSKAFFLKSFGAKVLSQELNIDIKHFSVPLSKDKVQVFALDHTIHNATLYIEMIKALKSYPDIKILEWRGEQNNRHVYEYVAYGTGKKVRRELKPDSYTKISVSGKTYEIFIEFDTGTEGNKKLKEKFMRYFEYMSFGNWQEHYSHFPFVLFITQRNKSAMEKMIQAPDINENDLIYNRNKFTNTSNIIYGAVGQHENLYSIGSDLIQNFINHTFIFTYTYELWTELLISKLK
jgi:hypothetical protein